MRRGFTLIELIIVISLIALVGGLVIVSGQGFLRGLGEEPVERILQKAVREARFQAAANKEPAYLYYDETKGDLLILTEAGSNLGEFNLVTGQAVEELELEFEQILPANGLESFSNAETVPIDRVAFRPDRSSTPFQVTIRRGSLAFTQQYDPFSAIVIHDTRNP